MAERLREGSATEAGAAVPHVGTRLPILRNRLTWADGLLLCLDFDGTLAPIVENPDEAALHPEVDGLLRTLRDHPDVVLAVVSGRALDDVRSRVGLDGLHYAGNHGLETLRDGDRVVDPDAAEAVPAVERIVDRLEADLADVSGAHVEDKGVTATVHVRQAAPDQAEDVADHVRSVTADEPVRLTTGKEVLEVRPRVDCDKGQAVRRLVEDHPGHLPMYVGDDTTDEAAFRELDPSGVSVHVGDGRDTAATARVDDPDQVAALLAWLAETGTDRLAQSPR